MGMSVFDVGDEVYYPNFRTPSSRKMTVQDRKVMVYQKSGKFYVRYLFDETLLQYLAQDLRDSIASSYDNVVAICGFEGVGKSSLALRLCKCLDPDFDMEKSYVYSYKDFVDALANADEYEKGKIFWMDEGSLMASNRDAMTDANKKFVQILETMRSRGWTLIITLPSLERLDIYAREHRVRYLLTALETSWDVKRTTASRGYYELQVKTPGSTKFHSIGYGTFGKMTEEESKVYEKLKRESQSRLIKKITGQGEDEERQDRRFSKNFNERWGDAMLALREKAGMTPDEIVELTGLSKSTVEVRMSEARKRRREKNGNQKED